MTERLDLSQLLTARAGTQPAVDLGLDHPPAYGLLAYTELLGHHRRGGRQRGVLALVVIDQSYRSGLELIIDLLRHGAHPPGLKQERHQTWGASVDVACVTREIATTNQNLTGPAAAMSHRANTDLKALEDLDARGGHAKNGGRAKDVVWVSPGDVHANRLIAIPAPVRASLIGATDTLVQTSSNAMSAAACLDRGPHQVPKVEAATGGGGRVDQDRDPTSATPPRSVVRER